MQTFRASSSTTCIAIALSFGTALSSHAAPANQASPFEARAQLQRLEAQEPLGTAAIPNLETLLSSETDLEGLIAQSENRFRDTEATSQKAYELAYRLMRLYEKSGQMDKVQTLGLRIARGDKPFKVRVTNWSSSSSHGIPEWANAALALAVQLASDERQQQALAKVLQNSQWVGARAQIERRLHGPNRTPVAPAFGWANLPRGVQLLASNQNVLSICHDKWRIFVGHPWGIAIYALDGRPVTRVAIGTGALSMTVCNGALWAGTANGLVRVDLKTFAVSLLPGDQDLRSLDKEENFHDFNNGVMTVAARGAVVWIGTRRDVRTYNTRTGALRIFSPDELKVNSRNEWSRFLFDENYVWADNDEDGCRRYDTRTGLWQVPVSAGSKLTLIGMSDGKLWANLWLNDQLRNGVALIDRRTLKFTWLPFDGPLADERIDQPLSLSGTFRGQPTFDGDSRFFRFYSDSLSGHLRPNPQLQEQQRFFVARRPANLPTDTATWLNPAGDFDEQHNTSASIACLPNGARVVGARSTRTRYQYSSEDWPYPEENWPSDYIPSETTEGQGGLTLISPDGKSRSLTNTPRTDCLMGDEVFFALAEHMGSRRDRVWLGTQRGLALLDSSAQVKNIWAQRDGLIWDRIVSGAFLQGKLYLGTSYGGGGLAIYDPSTSVFTARLSQDGLAAAKLIDVRTQGERLKVSYGVEYLTRGNDHYQQYPPSYYDPSSDTFTPVVPPVIMTQKEAQKVFAQTPSNSQNASTGNEFPVHAPMPFLGGFVISTTRVGSRTFVCGTRGVMVLEGAKVPFRLSPIAAKITPNSPAFQIVAALRRAKPIKTPAELARALADTNLYSRAEALASLLLNGVRLEPYVPLVVKATSDPAMRVRATSLNLLLSLQNDVRITPVLQKALHDPDIKIRGLATIELLQRGIVPSESHLIEVLNGCRQGTYENFPLGAQSSIGADPSTSSLLPLLAPHATPAIFALLMQDPPHLGDYNYATTVFPALGAALLKRPESATVLLSATDRTGIWEQPRFVHEVFGFADKTVLPVIHNALKSTDPLVRANAARACERIGDASSIEPLIRALDLKSDMSRIPIIGALGTLKAESAIPILATLYAEAVTKLPQRRPFEFSSSGASARVPQGQLQVTQIRAAVRAIGPQAEVLFARALSARRGGAILLSQNENDLSFDMAVLEGLWLDEDENVRIGAAVSLLRLGKDAPRNAVLQWLQSNDESVKNRVLDELQSLRPERLIFARAIIQSVLDNPKSSDSTKELTRALLNPSRPRTGFGF